MIFSKIRVLLLDDEPLILKFVSDLLRQMGVHQIHEARDGKSALVEVIKFQPDLILADIHMQPMDGFEFVKQLHGLPNTHLAHIPVILLTADSNKETIADALPLGIKGYMLKPPSMESLKAKIKSILK